MFADFQNFLSVWHSSKSLYSKTKQ